MTCRHDEAEEDDAALREAYLGVCGGTAVRLLSARLVWLHYFILATPMPIFAGRPPGDANKQPHWRSFVYRAVGLFSLLVFSKPSHLVPHCPLLFNLATFLLFVLVLWDTCDDGDHNVFA